MLKASLVFFDEKLSGRKKTTMAKVLFFIFSLFCKSTKSSCGELLMRVKDTFLICLAQQKEKRTNFLMLKSCVEKKFHFLFFFQKKLLLFFTNKTQKKNVFLSKREYSVEVQPIFLSKSQTSMLTSYKQRSLKKTFF